MGNALSAAFMAMNGVALLGRLDEPDPERQSRALEVLRLVASRRPNCDVFVRRATSQFSPLMLAAEAGALEAVKILLAAGANPNLQNQGKYSALDFAVDRPPVWSQLPAADRVEIVRVLLAAGAKVDKKGADGVSPLERARRAGNTAAVELLSRTR
jgi:ankyrin repeat protein